MPSSRKRSGHHYQKPAEIPARQRTNGRAIFAVLFGAFGAIIALFATDANFAALIIGALCGAFVGYFIGKNMEREAGSKQQAKGT